VIFASPASWPRLPTLLGGFIALPADLDVAPGCLFVIDIFF
jgi:hypothetical protein